MNLKNYYVLPSIIAAASIIFFIIPTSLSMFSFSGIKFLAGEIWRIITFPFVHINMTHLFENLFALGATSVLAFYANLPKKEFSMIFVGSGIILALTDTLIFPTIIITGASIGIYAILGSIAAKGTDFISHHILIGLLASTVFFKYLTVVVIEGKFVIGEIFNQTWLHLTGFVIGIALFYILELNYKNKRVLNCTD